MGACRLEDEFAHADADGPVHGRLFMEHEIDTFGLEREEVVE